ncbi:MAG: hypothetical protein WD851_11510 [Pirellulales bacterium]
MAIVSAANQLKAKTELMRQTYLERRWPVTPMFQNIAVEWCADQSRRLLELVWRGYDLLFANDLHIVAFAANDEAKEESLNYLLTLRIDQCKGNAPFSVVHQPPEQTKRKRGKGRSPQPDIGFALYEQPRTVWPMEGKVLINNRDVTAYLAEIETNFVKARYATFSSEGAMLGYLVVGDAETVMSHINNDLGTVLRNHPNFKERPHRLSDHIRTNLPHPNSPARFVCHHLILCLSST